MVNTKSGAKAPQPTGLIIPNDANAKNIATKWIEEDVVADFTQIPEWQKLSVLQTTPEKYILERKVGWDKGADVMAKYVPHTYAKKALNFVFAFNISTEIINPAISDRKETYMDYKSGAKNNQGKNVGVSKERPYVLAEATVRFTFKLKDGSEIKRDVYTSHKGYPAGSLTRADMMKAAISKAWTQVAETFGIGAELEREREDQELAEQAPEVEVSEAADNSDIGY